jgi:hypothetical protein
MNLTITFMIAGVVIVALFDVYIILKKGKSESISAHVIRGSHKYPLLVLLCGMVLGHLFWNMKTVDIYGKTECIQSKEK